MVKARGNPDYGSRLRSYSARAPRLSGCVADQNPVSRPKDRCSAELQRSRAAQSRRPRDDRPTSLIHLADRHLTRATQSDVLLGRYLKLIAEARGIAAITAFIILGCVGAAVAGGGWHLAASAGLLGGSAAALRACRAIRRRVRQRRRPTGAKPASNG
jgi:hypothetical protein